MGLALAASLCLASGYLVVCMGRFRRESTAADFLFEACLSVGFGVGIFSVVYFLSLLLQVAHPVLLDVVPLAMLLAGFFMFRHRPQVANRLTPAKERNREPVWLRRLLIGAFAVALCVALYAGVMRTRAHPHGDGWDAFAIWNLHARFLFRGGPHWRDGFTTLLPWSHPDYPLLLPAVIAHFWSYLGYDSPAVPAVLAFIFTFSTVGLLFSSLVILRGGRVAMLGGLALLATPAFLETGAWQYADIPLGFFFLAAIALFCIHDDRVGDGSSPRAPGLLALSGLSAGFAAWTKNEGLLFFCAIILARLLLRSRHNPSPSNKISGVSFTPFLVASAPVLLLIIYFKRAVAPAGDLFSDPAITLHRLLSAARYWAVIKWYVKEFFRFGHWMVVPVTVLMVVGYFALGRASRNQHPLSFRISRLALILTLAGYFFIYLITPYGIYWHLRFSLDRLLLQLWPSTILLFFLALPDEPLQLGAGDLIRRP